MNQTKSKNNIFFLHIEGMDLSGKSTVAKIFAETSKLNWVINDKRLTENNPFYDFAWDLGKKGRHSSEILGHLYLESLKEDIKNFRPNKNILQDSTLLLRSLNFYKTVEINNELAHSFAKLIPEHPLPNKSFYLTADIESRRQRLEKRIKQMPKKLTSMDMMIMKDPHRFMQIDKSLCELSVKIFNSQVIDTSEMDEIEVVECIRRYCPLEMQK